MIPIEELLEAGVHFGHRVNKWNPKMAPYIFGERNGVHIIDLIQTVGYLDSTYTFLNTYVSPSSQKTRSNDSSEGLGKKVLFVGTRKQVAGVIKKEAENCHSNYVNYRWLGGLLTNWATIRLCVAKLNKLDGLVDPSLGESAKNNGSGFVQGAKEQTKKERAILKKQHEKLKKFFGGIQYMTELPEIVILVGQDCEMNAVHECHTIANTVRLDSSKDGKTSQSKAGLGNIRTITLLDTNCDPELADLFIPANDDSTKSVELILGSLGQAIRTNQKN
jgi:small subunit ribosomal protein S2